MIPWLLLACTPTDIPSTPPVPPDDPVLVLPDLPVDPAPFPGDPTLAAVIEPAAPAFDDDLRCRLDHINERDLVGIAWSRDSEPWTGATATHTLPGDTIPHLLQAGGDVWACSATLDDGTTLTSPPATVAHPVPMVVVPAGTLMLDDDLWAHEPTPFTISRPYWLAETELSREQFLRYAGYEGVPEYIITIHPTDFDMPTMGGWSEVAWFANLLSRSDGLPECYACDGVGRSATCAFQPRAPDCEGYRLPTRIEWIFAYYEAGAHNDPLPAGGYWEHRRDETLEDLYDAPALGPHAPPGTFISDQCWMMGSTPTGNPAKVRTLLPNALGLFNMCSNISEWYTDQRSHKAITYLDFVGFTFDSDIYRYGSFASSDVTPINITPLRVGGGGPGLRLTRTRHSRGDQP